MKKIFQINIIKFIYYNYLCKKVKRDKGAKLIPYRGARIELKKGACLILHANLNVCIGKVKGSHEEAYVQLHENSVLEVNGHVMVAYGAMIQAHPNAKITIGQSYLNTRATIVAEKEINIGNDVLISRDSIIFDSDFHPVFNEEGERANEPKAVNIENHVWIGVKAVILRGVTLHEGAVIGATALVTADVKEKVMISGMPGRAFGYIDWRTK
ncbi:MAG: acyltransferase [Lachnospiraceae bacterium]|nr:acyltransferase [Lachnospiraceae bacterium]